MKHLKPFNESLTKEDLQDYCESQLAYLIDEGFTIQIYDGQGRSYSTIQKGNFIIWLHKNHNKDFFKWDEVKDYYIPFLQLLSTKYEINNFLQGARPSIRFRNRIKKDYSFVNVNSDFVYTKVINGDIFDTEGYWKDHIFYKWKPDPDISGIAVYIKEKK